VGKLFGANGLLGQFLESILVFVHGLVGNWGMAIIGLTILIKLALLPLTLKQDKSMQKMKAIQPELDKLRAQYGNNPEELNKKTMELYKEHQVNPAGGCLPLLLQMPILFALFGILRKTPELGGVVPTGASFLWLNLSNPDPIYLLPILNGVTSFLQQKVMGTGGQQNDQMKMMTYTMPLMMVFISFRMPSGLQLYWFVSSLITMAQQYFISKGRADA